MYTLESGDLRIGINLLRSCGNIAEADASREITQEHFDEAVASLVSVNVSDSLKNLNDVERTVLKLIADNEGMCSAGQLSKICKEDHGFSYASFNRAKGKYS